MKFVKGDVKEEIARKHFQRAEREGRYGVVMVGVAQEKTSAWRGWRDGGPDGHPHFVYRRQSIFPNNYYFYIRDPDWGPTFIKTVAYAPLPVWIYLNGNEWAKQQAAQQGIEFKALDNGFASCEDPKQLAAICNSLSAARCPRVLRSLAGGAALTAHDGGSPSWVRARARVPATGDLRHPHVRSAGRRARLV